MTSPLTFRKANSEEIIADVLKQFDMGLDFYYQLFWMREGRSKFHRGIEVIFMKYEVDTEAS